MTIETQIDLRSYSRLMLTLTFRKPVPRIVSIVGIAIIINALIYFFGINFMFEQPPYFQFILGILVLAYIPLSTYRQAKLNYSTYEPLREKIVYQFSDEKIQETGENFESELTWEEISWIEELKKWVICYLQDGGAIFLPKASFGNQLDDFRRLVQQKMVEINR